MKRDILGRRLSPLVQPAASAESAGWLEDRLLTWGRKQGTRVGSIVPLGFGAYARLLHPAFGSPPRRARLRWQEIGERLGHTLHAETQWESFEERVAEAGEQPPWHEPPEIGRCPPEVIVPLREHLSRHTGTPSDIYYAMWIGFTDVRSVLPKVPRFALPGREYALLTGPIAALPRVIDAPYETRISPSLSWPADRGWCVATEVDFRWTYVGATEELVRDLEADGRLEVLRTVPGHRGDLQSDWPAARGHS